MTLIYKQKFKEIERSGCGKKGTIEFSLTTIIVIVISITIINLGLWIRGLFSSVRILTDEVVGGADNEIGNSLGKVIDHYHYQKK